MHKNFSKENGLNKHFHIVRYVSVRAKFGIHPLKKLLLFEFFIENIRKNLQTHSVVSKLSENITQLKFGALL